MSAQLRSAGRSVLFGMFADDNFSFTLSILSVFASNEDADDY